MQTQTLSLARQRGTLGRYEQLRQLEAFGRSWHGIIGASRASDSRHQRYDVRSRRPLTSKRSLGAQPNVN